MDCLKKEKSLFIDAHSCKELHSRSHKYALQNFQQVVGTEEFLLLPFSEVGNMILVKDGDMDGLISSIESESLRIMFSN